MRTPHIIVGYDKETSHITAEHRLPGTLENDVLSLISIDEDDEDAVFSYELDIRQAARIGQMIDQELSTKCIWFIEPAESD